MIELYNAGTGALERAGYSLSDDPGVTAKYVFPVGTIIEAGGYLVVHADAALSSPGLHTGFGLSENGDSLRLYDSAANGGALLDSISFGRNWGIFPTPALRPPPTYV